MGVSPARREAPADIEPPVLPAVSEIFGKARGACMTEPRGDFGGVGAVVSPNEPTRLGTGVGPTTRTSGAPSDIDSVVRLDDLLSWYRG